MREREPQTPAAGLGREARLEDTFPVALGYALARILDIDGHSLLVGADRHIDVAVALYGIQSILQKVLHNPLEQRHIEVGLHGRHGKTVVREGHVARDALAEIHDRLTHNLIYVRRRENRLRTDLREAVDDLEQVSHILVHLLDYHRIDILRTQILDPPQKRRGGRTELVRRLLRKAYPHTVLLVLLGGLQRYVGEDDEYGYYDPLHVGKVVERPQQRRLAVEDDVAAVAHPHHPHRARRILLRQFVQLAAELLGVLDHILRNTVIGYKVQVLIGDDEGDVVLRADDMRYERVGHVVAEILAAHTLHGRHPQLHIVLLLLFEHVGQLVGVDERHHSQNHAYHQHRYAAAKREFTAMTKYLHSLLTLLIFSCLRALHSASPNLSTLGLSQPLYAQSLPTSLHPVSLNLYSLSLHSLSHSSTLNLPQSPPPGLDTPDVPIYPAAPRNQLRSESCSVRILS